MNTYGYVGANPLNYTDPYGLCPLGGVLCVGVPTLVITGGLISAAAQSGKPKTLIWPDDFKPINPWTDTNTETGVATNILPPEIPDKCESKYNKEIKKCKSGCNNKISFGACAVKAKINYWICKGAKRPKFGDNDFGDGGGPGYSGF